MQQADIHRPSAASTAEQPESQVATKYTAIYSNNAQLSYNALQQSDSWVWLQTNLFWLNSWSTAALSSDESSPKPSIKRKENSYY